MLMGRQVYYRLIGEPTKDEWKKLEELVRKFNKSRFWRAEEIELMKQNNVERFKGHKIKTLNEYFFEFNNFNWDFGYRGSTKLYENDSDLFAIMDFLIEASKINTSWKLGIRDEGELFGGQDNEAIIKDSKIIDLFNIHEEGDRDHYMKFATKKNSYVKMSKEKMIRKILSDFSRFKNQKIVSFSFKVTKKNLDRMPKDESERNKLVDRAINRFSVNLAVNPEILRKHAPESYVRIIKVNISQSAAGLIGSVSWSFFGYEISRSLKVTDELTDYLNSALEFELKKKKN